MSYLDVASETIPGYKLLTQEQRDEFEQSEIGIRFVTILNKRVESLKSATNNGEHYKVFGLNLAIFSIHHKKYTRQYEKECEQDFSTLTEEFPTNLDYQKLMTNINYQLLQRWFEDFSFLNERDKTKLANASISKSLQLLIPIDEAMEKESIPAKQQELESQAQDILAQWTYSFRTTKDLAPLKVSIAREKAKIRLKRLTQLFPILNHPIEFAEASPAEEFLSLFAQQNEKEYPDYLQMEEAFLTTVIFRYLQKNVAKHISYVELHNFNIKEAQTIAKRIIKNKGPQNLKMDEWLDDYKNNLLEHIEDKLLFINGKKREAVEIKEDEGWFKSLSYLFWHSKSVERTTDFFTEVADAHAFIQYTGMSTQNESSYLVLLDLYNYGRNAKQITEIRKILNSLLSPFKPLYDEYRELSLYEKNGFRKILRAAMPLILVAAFVVAVFALLSPLALPELAFFIIAIPVLLIGFYMAAKYVTIKNDVYQSTRQKHYGGPYEIPEFQVNDRMTKKFGNNAELIRSVYIDELKACDALITKYSKKSLSDEQMKFRDNVIEKRYAIQMEWYDIHSNLKFGTNRVPLIVQNRLNAIFSEEIKHLTVDFNKEKNQIQENLNTLVDELKDIFADPLVQNVEKDEDNSAEENSAETDAKEFRFFKPRCAERQAKAMKIDGVLDLFTPQPTTPCH